MTELELKKEWSNGKWNLNIIAYIWLTLCDEAGKYRAAIKVPLADRVAIRELGKHGSHAQSSIGSIGAALLRIRRTA